MESTSLPSFTSPFFIATTIPQIESNISFLKMFVVDISEVELLQEAHDELKLALATSINDIKLCLRLANTYLERLTSLDEPVRKTKQEIKWKNLFTDLGKDYIKLQIKERSHLKVEIYMVRISLTLGTSDQGNSSQGLCGENHVRNRR
jgi:hypothetical protein